MDWIKSLNLENWSSPASPLFLGVLAWSLLWKGLALWRSAQNKEKVWFLVLFLFNSLGILDIIYLILTRSKVYDPQT